ncbi:MAG: CopG family transcriptional regulator [Planctomycetes bacterium]|nr:CopG family transcriptional regulator [Planctomycetota bacterium]
MRESKVTVKIPRPLYRKIQLVIDNSGFSSPTDFIVFVLRDLVGEAEKKSAAAAVPGEAGGAAAGGGAEDFDANDLEAVKQKLKNLGYL